MLERMTDPYAMLRRLQQLMTDLTGTDWMQESPGGRGTYPPVNVFKRGDDYVVVAEVPGVRREDLAIEVKGNQLRIAGQRPEVYGEGVQVHRRERRSGHFDRLLNLPLDVDETAVRAEVHEGMLAVLLPVAAHARRRVVPVQ